MMLESAAQNLLHRETLALLKSAAEECAELCKPAYMEEVRRAGLDDLVSHLTAAEASAGAKMVALMAAQVAMLQHIYAQIEEPAEREQKIQAGMLAGALLARHLHTTNAAFSAPLSPAPTTRQ